MNTKTMQLNETVADKDTIVQYRQYLNSGNKQGQQRLLNKLRRSQTDALRRNREKLACLDYIMARIEKTDMLPDEQIKERS